MIFFSFSASLILSTQNIALSRYDCIIEKIVDGTSSDIKLLELSLAFGLLTINVTFVFQFKTMRYSQYKHCCIIFKVNYNLMKKWFKVFPIFIFTRQHKIPKLYPHIKFTVFLQRLLVIRLGVYLFPYCVFYNM